MGWIIIGDTKDNKDCLIYVCGSKENAEKVIERMLNNPDENDKRTMKNHFNLRIKETKPKEEWWNDTTSFGD